MSHYPPAGHTSASLLPLFCRQASFYKMKHVRAETASSLPDLLGASSLSLPSVPPSLFSCLPACLGCGPAADPSVRQPPDWELTWTLDTVPARLTRLFAQSRVDNSSNNRLITFGSRGGTGLIAVTNVMEGGEQGTATVQPNLCRGPYHHFDSELCGWGIILCHTTIVII